MTQYSGKIIRKNPVTPTQQSASGVWTTADAAAAVKNNNWPVAGVPNPISRSVRLRSSASAYFNRTFGSSGDQVLWTWSAWVKRGTLGGSQVLFGRQVDGSTIGYISFESDKISVVNKVNESTGGAGTTTAVFRDPSAWYHIVVAFNGNGSAATDKIKIYVNSVLQIFSSSQNLSTGNGYINVNLSHAIGRRENLNDNYFDGYLTEINFIGGQALTPSSFGETNAITGVWQPKRYAGTYGTNGFYLNFSDNSGVTATTIGKDYSGNGNNWTPNNISITAGVTYDSMLDVPTLYADGGNGRGNYCVLNAAIRPYPVADNIADGNLKFTSSSASVSGSAWSTIPITTSKWYAECTVTTASASSADFIGVSNDLNFAALGTYASALRDYGYTYKANGNKCNNSSTGTAYGASYTSGDVIGVALDAGDGTIEFFKNGTSQGTAYTGMTYNGGFLFGSTAFNGGVHNWNFGQRPFAYTPPTGFKALNTQNLPTPTISNGATVMAATLYTGNGSTQSLTNTVNGISFQPDLVWVKARSLAYSNYLYDSVRGTGTSKSLISDATAVEGAGSANANLTSFDASGFSLGTTSGVNGMNANAGTFVAWQWNAGGSTVTNTSGSISAQVRANATAGFSVVTYTGTAANATVGHGLGVAPSMIITKNRDSATAWWVYHTSLGNTQYLVLNTTAAAVTSSSAWNNTSPTSTVFSLGAANPSNANQDVAYCFAAVAGYSAFGSYTGNGSADGSFVFLGFRPRFVMIKNITNAQPWIIIDTARNTFNVAGDYLSPDSSGAENYASSRTTATNDDILSNGFKLRNDASSSGYTNASANTYIYAAFAENPFKYSNAR